MKRTPLTRRTPLVGRRGLARTSGLRTLASTGTTSRRPATGPTAAQRQLVVARAQGLCERCGETFLGGYSIHHRQPRGMGGSALAAANDPTNLVLLCGSGTTGCHGWIETHRADAYATGWLVRRPGRPAAVPITHHTHGVVLLELDGTYRKATP